SNQNGRDNGGGNAEVHNLYVTNLSFKTTDESLRAGFEPHGEIHTCSIIKEPVTHTSRGFGFVSYAKIDDAEAALAAMHGCEVDGRQIRVEKARMKNGYQKTPG
ncbi:putative transformer-SR ribonucleoprotein, partial [Ochromonadaceae sp. CCMP2298]